MDIAFDDTDDSCVCVCECMCERMCERTYLIDGTHPCYGSYVISDGDQCCSGQVFLTDAVSLLLAHHVTKTVKTTCQYNLNININAQTHFPFLMGNSYQIK